MEIHDHGDKVEEETENEGRDRYWKQKRIIYQNRTEASNKGKRKYIEDFSFCDNR